MEGASTMAEPVLRKGSNDPAVRDLQQALKALGHDPGPVDGVFGDTTESAVKAFQQEREIPVWDCRQGHLDQHRRGRPERARSAYRVDWSSRPSCAKADEPRRI
jgi:hypothetical protein